MNIRCKFIVLISVMIFSLLPGCVKNNEDTCSYEVSQGLNLYFYSKTPCDTDSIYPEEIKDIMIYLFDRNDFLTAYEPITNVNPGKDYFEQIRVQSGIYTVLVWSGLTDEYLLMNELKIGVTTKEDLLFRIKRNEEIAYPLEDKVLYYGEYSPVYVEENHTSEVHWQNVKVNMKEMVNRITVSVEGLENPDDFEIIIEANNGAMNVNGTIAPDETLIYEGTYMNDEEILAAHFAILKLQTGYVNTLVIRNKTNDTEVYRGNLLGTLLLKNPDVNLDCDHDFTINFTAEDQCDCGTYMITEIWVNDWLVHSYDTQM